MKTIRLLFLLFIAVFAIGCDSPQLLEEKEYSFYIFRYADETYKEWIITTNDSIPKCPKRYKNEPYFGNARWAQNPEKYQYDLCELATEEKLLALHEKYYTYFPYTAIHGDENCVARKEKWGNICNANLKDLPVLCSANALYSEIRSFEISSLEKITEKKRQEMTIDDIAKAINTIIDSGQLDKYSTKVSTMWASHE